MAQWKWMAVGMLVAGLLAASAQAGVILTENQEADGVGWPETLTWATYSANYGGTAITCDSSNPLSQTITVAAADAGKIDKFLLRYSDTTNSNDTYDFEIYEVADPTANPLVLGTKILDVSFTLTTATTATKPVLTLDLTGGSQVSLDSGKYYAFHFVATGTGTMIIPRRGGALAGGQAYKNLVPVYTSPRDLVVGYTIVPEPATLALLGLGGLGLLLRRRR